MQKIFGISNVFSSKLLTLIVYFVERRSLILVACLQVRLGNGLLGRANGEIGRPNLVEVTALLRHRCPQKVAFTPFPLSVQRRTIYWCVRL